MTELGIAVGFVILVLISAIPYAYSCGYSACAKKLLKRTVDLEQEHKAFKSEMREAVSHIKRQI